ncbi:MAG: L-2-amino-thiazoline-4-carboxylic acid hydrolase, partial [Spirochaetota bacterium]
LQKLIEGLEETWGLLVGFLIKGVLKEYGKKAREPLKQAMIDFGRFTGNKYIEENKITEKGIVSFSKYFFNISDVDVFDIDVLESNEKRFVIKTCHCPYLKYWKEVDIDKEVPFFCEFTTSADLGIALAFDPGVKLKLLKNMLKGDDCCIYSFEV